MSQDVITVGICDDDIQFCIDLSNKIHCCLPEAEIRVFESAEELLRTEMLPEILILDIRLPGMNGLQAAEQIRNRDNQPILILTSGSEEYVFRAFDVQAYHYLVKPFTEARFQEVFRRAVTALKADHQVCPRIVVSCGGSHISVAAADILWAEVFNRRVTLHTKQGDIEYYGKLQDLQKELPKGFFRPHRSFLINLDCVDSYNARSIDIRGTSIPLAKKIRPEFVRAYMYFLRASGGL